MVIEPQRGHGDHRAVRLRQVDLIRCLNRMHEVVRGARAEGQVLLGDRGHLRARASTRCAVRRRIGMVFQKPNPFPMMSIYDNVAPACG